MYDYTIRPARGQAGVYLLAKNDLMWYNNFNYLAAGHKRGSEMKIQESAENYLETILVLQKRNGNVRSIDIANELGYSKPSVSVAMKSLRLGGYIRVDPEGSIHLLDDGRAIAEKIYERHTLLSEWLTNMGVDPEIAAEDACRIEHVISAETFDALKRHAGMMTAEAERAGQ